MGGKNSGRKNADLYKTTLWLGPGQWEALEGMAERMNQRAGKTAKKITGSHLIRYAIERLIKDLE